MNGWRRPAKRLKTPVQRRYRKSVLVFFYYLFSLLYLNNVPGFSQEPFYRGKTIRIIVDSSLRGGYDTYSRIYARHLGKHIPGNPTIIVENKPGAAGLIAANELFKIAKPDGLTIGMVAGPPIVAQLLQDRDVKFDARKFEWIGAPAREQNICLIKSAAGFASIESWAGSEVALKLGASSRKERITAMILQKDLSIPVQIESGYRRTGDIQLATEQGDLDGACGVSKIATNTIWSPSIAEQRVNVIPLSANLGDGVRPVNLINLF